MDKQVILAVDDNGEFIEYISKSAGHIGEGIRHLAITVLVYNSKGDCLLQRRKHKVFDNIWDFSASTHPLHKENGSDENIEDAARRALLDEYGVKHVSNLRKIGEFNYFAKIGELCENEHDNLLIGEYNGEVNLNSAHGYEYRWVDKKEVLKDIEENPKKYTPWAIEGIKVLKEKGFFE